MNIRQSNSAQHAVVLLLCLVCSAFAANSNANPNYRTASSPTAASTVTRKAPTRHFKGQRKQGWKRRELISGARSYNPLESTTIVVKGKGKGSGGTAYGASEEGRTTFLIKCKEAKEKAMKDKYSARHKGDAPHDVCDEVYGDGGDYGAVDGDGSGYGGSDGDYGAGNTDGGDGYDSGYDGSATAGSNGDDPSTDGSYLSGASGSDSSCADIALGNGPTRDNLKEYKVYLDVVKNNEFTWDEIEDFMQKDLQYNVAPKVSDCDKDAMAAGYYDGNVQDGGDGSSEGGQTLITNVVFENLGQTESACQDDYNAVAQEENNRECSAMVIPANIYYTGSDTSGFADRLENAINNHFWSVPGLVDVSGATVTETSKVSSAVAAESEEDEGLKPGGFVAIAAAFLVLLLLLAMLVRRKRRQDVKHIELGDDDDTYLKDIEGDSQDSPRRMAHLVGDEDSVLTGWTGNSHLRSKSSTMPSFDGEGTDGFFRNTETRPSNVDVHKCSSAFCEVCESQRRAGLQFIPSTTPSSPALPIDASREYAADDTVNL